MERVYESDLSDAQWERVRPLLEAKTGRKASVCRRRILNAIFYLARTGCQWRYLPKEFPHWSTVHSCYWRWRRNGLLDRLSQALHAPVRVAAQRHAQPSAAVVDSQSVKTTEKGGRAKTLLSAAGTVPKGSRDASGLC